MTVSYKFTERNWDPSSLLAYDALTNDQNESTISDQKSTVGTGADFYDRSLTSRRYALAGVACSIIFSLFCIVTGTLIVATRGGSGVAPIVKAGSPKLKYLTEMLNLALNLIVALCTESAGFVHSISLRSALASESRLRFNTNLRLLTAVGSWRNPNGALLNGIMAVLLILSYVSASLVITVISNTEGDLCVGIAGLSLLFLGVMLFLQAAIALSGAYTVKVLTWSGSPFDLTAASVYHAQLTPVPFRCMHRVSDLDMDLGPVRPSETQPSAWHAHPSIRKVVISLWGLVIAYAAWAALVRFLSVETGLRLSTSNYATALPQGSQGIAYEMSLGGSFWLSCLNMGLIQGPLTLGLHCSELIANVIRDERRWRCATGRSGLRTAMNPLKSFFTNPLGVVLFIAKPVLHWMFGLAFFLGVSTSGETTDNFYVYMFTFWILYLCLALFVFACFFTFVALRRPRGPQPAAYGHLQTLANLVDEWSPVMWWGHKEDGIPYCHAGTSDHLLPAVKMDCVYAGSSLHDP